MHLGMYIIYAYAQIYGATELLHLTAEHSIFLFTPKCSAVSWMIGLL